MWWYVGIFRRWDVKLFEIEPDALKVLLHCHSYRKSEVFGKTTEAAAAGIHFKFLNSNDGHGYIMFISTGFCLLRERVQEELERSKLFVADTNCYIDPLDALMS